MHLDRGGQLQYSEESDHGRTTVAGPGSVAGPNRRADGRVATLVPVLEGGQHYSGGGHRDVRPVPPGEVQLSGPEDLLRELGACEAFH